MPLNGRDYLAVALCSVAAGLWLSPGELPPFFIRFNSANDHYLIALMATSVFCLWSSMKFLVLNRQRRDVRYFLVVLAPIILTSLFVICSYVIYLVQTYYTIHAFNARFLVN